MGEIIRFPKQAKKSEDPRNNGRRISTRRLYRRDLLEQARQAA